MLPLLVADEMALRGHIELLRAQVDALRHELVKRDRQVRDARMSSDQARASLVEDIGAIDAAREYAEGRLGKLAAQYAVDKVSMLLRHPAMHYQRRSKPCHGV